MGNNVGGPQWASQRDMEIAGAVLAAQQGLPQPPPPPDPAEPGRRRRNARILAVIGVIFLAGGVADLLGANSAAAGMGAFAFSILFAVLALAQLRRGARVAALLETGTVARP